MMRSPRDALLISLQRHLVIGVAVVVFSVGVACAWAATTVLSNAVIAQGTVVVDGNVKKIQHPTGGVVAELLVRDGDIVRAGEIVLKLDDTIIRSRLAVASKNLDQFAARTARLIAERDGQAQLMFLGDILLRSSNLDVAAAMESERRLFDSRRSAREGKKAQHVEEIVQLEEKIGGMAAQQSAKTEEIELIEKELTGVRSLYEKGLVPLSRVNGLDRQAARLKGERGQLIAATAEARGKISETNLTIIQVDQDLRSEVATELRDIEAKQAELIDRRVTAEDQLNRVDVRAPISGMVHQLAIHTIGGVVAAGSDLMEIVPQGIDLIVEAKVEPKDIDQVHIGQAAMLRMVAFNRSLTPELSGKIFRVSPGLITDERTKVDYYQVGVRIPYGEIARLKDQALLPGMPIEAFIKIADRTVLSYLTKPLHDHAARAFREE